MFCMSGLDHTDQQSGDQQLSSLPGDNTLCMSSLGHGPWIQAPTAGPVWAAKLLSLQESADPIKTNLELGACAG